MRTKPDFAPKVINDPHEALRRALQGKLEACADAVGVSHQTLSKQINEVDGAGLSLRRAAALEAFLDTDALAECFAARRGGVFIKLPRITGELPELVAGWARLLKEQADEASAFSAMVADGRITHAEIERFAAELRDCTIAGEQLLRAARVRAEKESLKAQIG